MNKQNIEDIAKNLWGNDLHKDFIAPVHSVQFEEVFRNIWLNSLSGDLLEIGCGSGADLASFIKLDSFKTITAIDLGDNVLDLAETYKDSLNVDIQIGNAMNLKFQDNSFDMVYSFGIFHHTHSPLKCFSEAYRVLRDNGQIFLYLYSSHEKYFFKKIGIWLEKFLMKIIRLIPYKLQISICIFLSPICWIFFSIPAMFTAFIFGKTQAKKIPFYWGTHPFSLIPDLKDRLMSPINHRFSYLEIELILKNLNFKNYNIQEKASGIYIYAKK